MIHSFFHLLFISIVALFPVVNPIGSALMVNPYFSGLDRNDKRIAVRKIAFYAFCLCTFFLFAGHLLLNLFGISIPVIQLAGGIMICKTGWESLTSDDTSQQTISTNDTNLDNQQKLNIENKLFYPITFPITTGAGTISVLFTLGAHSVDANITNYIVNVSAILVAIIIMCILVIIFFLNTKLILSYLGSHSETIINRLMSFLLFCVGLQIASTGIKSLFHI
ncbi:MAG: MarC family protein [Chitinophagaceae bacterium]|nr:MarC family protein [Chitinophagaceae bacterium]